ncbi:hypothetical protein [Halogeometricum luteum]|uniref:Uncharacterized protein n=1 Tax=Halogeometricum luteum TaxID=2950537 RepID=A0ABU2G7K9_9EURY|nr:hypothetical protein [Halogeometricum sp. S3BR5-2]MDS0296284.1 hypothetical protein [Halogeometricum sp. S3BR5-2]
MDERVETVGSEGDYATSRPTNPNRSTDPRRGASTKSLVFTTRGRPVQVSRFTPGATTPVASTAMSSAVERLENLRATFDTVKSRLQRP